MAPGMTREEIMADHPELEPEDFLACLAYAVKLAEFKSIHHIVP